MADAHYTEPRLAALYDPLEAGRADLEVYAAYPSLTGEAHNGDMSRVTSHPVNPVVRAVRAAVRSVTDRVMRWRGHPPENAGVREPRRPRPTLPSAAVALAEPRTGLRRWFRLTGGHETDHA